MRRSGKARRWGLFVEGAHWLVPQRRDELVELWHELVQACSKLSKDLVSVHGFNKGQLVAMGEPRDPLTRSLARTSTEIPLDVMIATAYDQQPFEVLIVAFDAHPANECLQPTASGALRAGRAQRPCQREELHFVLRHLAESEVLPAPFRQDAASLLAHYQGAPASSRATGRPPRGSLDLLYMDPEFEALVTSDDSAILATLSLKSRPKGWPQFPPKRKKHKDTLEKACRMGTPPRHLRGAFRESPHAWALEILRNASERSRLWQHVIAARLRLLLG